MFLVSVGVLLPRLLPQLAALPLPFIAPLVAPLVGPTGATYWVTRSLFLRGLGGIFSIAFSVALIQNKALIGDQVRGKRACCVLDYQHVGSWFDALSLDISVLSYPQGVIGK